MGPLPAQPLYRRGRHPTPVLVDLLLLATHRPRKTWTLCRTIHVRILQKLTLLPFKLGVFVGRDLSLEVPQKELESLDARFVWIPELEKEDIVGMVAEHAAGPGIMSIAIPAYWILREGTKWSPEHEKAREDEKVMLYLHGGGFAVRFFSPLYPVLVPILVSDGDSPSIASNSILRQRNAPILYISLQSVVGRLPTQLWTSL